MKINQQKGLTLIELLIAMALAGVVLSTLFGALNSAMNAHRSAERVLRRREPLLRLVTRFSDDIRAVFFYSAGPRSFSGASSKVDFFTLQEHWQKNDAGKIQKSGPVFTRVIYVFRDGKVYRAAARGADALKEAPAEGNTPVFTDAVKSLQFSYGYFDKDSGKEVVSDTWNDPGRLPDWLLLKIDAGAEGVFERKFYLV